MLLGHGKFRHRGMTAAVGIAALSRADNARALPLAATPLVFAVQQAIEGLLWINLPVSPDGSLVAVLTALFLFFAYVFWPVYAPITVLLIEPSQRRRRFMFVCLAVGIAVAAQLLWWTLTRPFDAVILDNHIVYSTQYTPSVLLATAYLAATGLPLVLSSQRTIIVLGVIILVGSTAAFLFYWEAFVSVWCYFAAAASVVILGHFEWSRRRRLRRAEV